MAAELTVSAIKAMNERECGKLRAAHLLLLIIQLPDEPTTLVADLASKVDGLVAFLDSRANRNAAAIINLEESNKELLHKNSKLERDVVSLNEKVGGITTQLMGIDQYLRVNNVEIIGLPEPRNGETVEEQALQVFNEL